MLHADWIIVFGPIAGRGSGTNAMFISERGRTVLRPVPYNAVRANR
jgi:hypothetical protein